MPGFNPTSLNYRVENANQSLLIIGDAILAFAQTVNHTFSFGTEGLYGIGTAKPQEIQQMRISPSITVDNLALSQTGITQLQGGSNLASILANNQFTITVADGITGNVRFSYIGCVSETFNETVAANRPLTDAYTFMAMDVLDQTGQSILNGQNALQNVATVAGAAGQSGLGLNINAQV